MIETIFYFAPDYGTYYSNWESGNISARTICFVPKGEGLGDIYKNGVKYGNTISETQLLEKIQEKIADIPFASTSTAGIVKLGKGLKAVGADGTVDVDFSGINDLSGLDELVEKILKDLIKDGVDGKDGLDALDYKITSFSTTTNGLNLTQGDKFNQTVDLTNVVKGIVSAWLQNPSDPTLPDFSQNDYSITAFGKNGTSLFISQNNNTQKSVDIQDIVKSSIQNLITNGDTIFNTIGSVVAVNPILTSGTQIATITVDGVTKTLYAPTSSEGGGGTTPGYDGPTEEEINDMIDQAKQDLQDEIDAARDVANKQKTRLDGLINTLGTEIQTKFEGMLADEEWMREHWPQGQQSSTSNFGQQDVEAYLQTLGIWDENEDHTRSNAKWTKIQQKVDTIELAVNALSSDGNITEALQSSINLAVNNGIASLNLETTYSKADETKKVIEWLTSGFRSATSSEMTYNDVVSAANNGDHSAISNLYSKVQRIGNEYVSESGVQSMVDNSISGLASEAYVDHATSQLSSSIGENAENIAAVRTYVDDKTSKASIVAAVGDVEGGLVLKSTHDEAIANLNTKFGDYSTTLVMESKINQATAGLVASKDLDGYVKKASVITSVNEDGSNVKINADKINIADITIQGSQVSGIDEIVAGKLDNLTIDATKVTNLAETIDARNANLEVHKLVTEGGNGTLMIDGTNGLYLEGVEAESKINMDGSGYFADGNISWKANGAVTIKGELNGATGTFSGALSGATGTFNGGVTATSGTIGGLRISESKLLGEKNGSGVEIEPGKVLVYNPANTQTSVSMSANQVQLYNVPLDVHAGAYLQSADIRKLIVLGESMQFGPTIVLPSQPEQGQIVFCINCKSVSASHTIYGASGDSNGTSTSWDTGQSRIFVFYYNAWYEFFCA